MSIPGARWPIVCFLAQELDTHVNGVLLIC